MLIKLIPPLILPFRSDNNVDIVYGLSSSLNQPYDMSSKRIRNQSHLSQEHHDFANNKGNFVQNMNTLFKSYKSLYKDTFCG
jgi:hypothetical protein